VAKERLKSPRARLFVALDLPEPVRAGLVAWQREALTDPALRPVSPQALHVTLCFLSYHPEKEIERIARIVCGLEPHQVTMRFEEEPIAVPRTRPRLFAVAAPSDEAVALQAELADRLRAERCYEPERRPFWPHVTACRVKPGKRTTSQRRGRGRPALIEHPPTALPGELLEPFGAPRVVLYRSLLHPAGAEYVPLAELDLSDPGG
jgi:2'-5' RNA ligase